MNDFVVWKVAAVSTWFDGNQVLADGGGDL